LARTTLPLPFPREVVRDLLGIAPALYRSEIAKTPVDRVSIEQLTQIGLLYKEALNLGTRYAPDTIAGRAARIKADRATVALGAFVAESAHTPAVAATAQRFRRVRSSSRSAHRRSSRWRAWSRGDFIH
jgi:hypothetical protein